jgi:hypothetical protein
MVQRRQPFLVTQVIDGSTHRVRDIRETMIRLFDSTKPQPSGNGTELITFSGGGIEHGRGGPPSEASSFRSATAENLRIRPSTIRRWLVEVRGEGDILFRFLEALDSSPQRVEHHEGAVSVWPATGSRRYPDAAGQVWIWNPDVEGRA